jgi:hypothetical protein
MFNPWFDIMVQATRMSWDAQLRILNFASGVESIPPNFSDPAKSHTESHSVPETHAALKSHHPAVATNALTAPKKKAPKKKIKRKVKQTSH